MLLPAACTAGVGARDSADWFLTEPEGLTTAGVPLRSKILAEDGRTIATFFYQNRVDVPLDKVAPVARKAVLAIEDSRFYEHGALDVQGTLRALASNVSSGRGHAGRLRHHPAVREEPAAHPGRHRRGARGRQGRSPPRASSASCGTPSRSSSGSPRTRSCERYLNIAYFGDGAYGIEAAARHYFSKHAAKLDLAEAALLAGVIRYPYAYDPTRHPRAAAAAPQRRAGPDDRARLGRPRRGGGGQARAAVDLKVTTTPQRLRGQRGAVLLRLRAAGDPRPTRSSARRPRTRREAAQARRPDHPDHDGPARRRRRRSRAVDRLCPAEELRAQGRRRGAGAAGHRRDQGDGGRT